MSTTKNNLSDLDLVITRNYLKPDKDKPNHFLYNTENSMKIFENNKNDIFTFEQVLNVVQDKTKKDTYIIKSSDIKTSHSDFTYKQCLMTGRQYEEIISMKIEIIKKTQKKTQDKSIIHPEDINVICSSINETKIPVYVGHGGVSNNKKNYYPESLETGGFFVTKNNIKKYVVFKDDRTCTWPRYSLRKTNFHHVSFSSVPLRFIHPLNKPQFLTIDMDFNLNKLDINIASKKTLPSLNIIVLISYLTKINLQTIKEFLLSRFMDENKIYDNRIIDIIHILFNKTLFDLEIFNKTLDGVDLKYSESKLIDIYIKKNFMSFYNKSKFDESNDIIFKKIFNELLLPGTNSLIEFLEQENVIIKTHKRKINTKGMTLLSVLENILIASFQNPIYHDKYHLANKRIASPGTTFEVIAIEMIKNLIKDYSEQLNDQLKNNARSGSNLTFKPYRKIQNVYNNIFNMQDKKHSIVIKPQKSTNFAQRFVTNNLIVRDSTIRLPKFFNCRDPNLTTWHYFGPVDTPDHAEYVGINRRLNVGTKLSDKDFNTHKQLVKEFYEIIREYIKTHSKLNDHIDKDVASIIMVDESETWIGCIEQNHVKTLYQSLLKKKRQNIFETNLIDISLIPCYTETPLKILMPIDKYRMLRINIGNKIPMMPAYLVENGELVFEHMNYKEDISELRKKTFNQMTQEYEIMEFLGPEQFTYSNVCENIYTFKSLSLEERKKYHYVCFDNSLNLSILESMIFDISKMPGTRGIFSASQLKNSITSIQPDSLNIIEASKFTISGFQEPCITNDVLLESRIPKQSFGTHIIVAYMAYNHNIEDSIIVNKESVNNGLFMTINTLLYKGETDFPNLGSEKNIKYFKNSYKKLDNDSVPKQNTVLEYGDALYGNSEAQLKKSNNVFYLQDNSIPYKFLIPGRVDRILLSTEDSTINIRYTVAVCHYLERGHKMTNQCAQKATISKVADAHELPYNSDGVKPDLILNSLSKIGRKTINMFDQTIVTNYYNMVPFGKDKKKEYINYKSFSNNNFQTFQKYKKDLKNTYPQYTENKINKIYNCEETLYDPYSGEMLKYDVFMGAIYFTRLTQISDEKISARNRGRLNKLNQPPSGKQKGGSHRLGEMEIDLIATHGCSNMIYEISKDSIEVQQYSLICQTCTGIATKVTNNNQSYYTCMNCENINLNPVFQRHLLSKTTKMLLGLLNFRGIKLNIKYNKTPLLFYSKLEESS